MGPNVKRLVVHKMSRDAVPDGGGVADAIGFLKDRERIAQSARNAQAWVATAIQAVRQSPGGEEFGDDEAIAAEILKRIRTTRGKR